MISIMKKKCLLKLISIFWIVEYYYGEEPVCYDQHSYDMCTGLLGRGFLIRGDHILYKIVCILNAVETKQTNSQFQAVAR